MNPFLTTRVGKGFTFLVTRIYAISLRVRLAHECKRGSFFKTRSQVNREFAGWTVLV